MTQPFRGIFAIAQTPFTDSGEILWDDFEVECDWIVRAGAHGFVHPVMVSEFTVLSFPERVQAMGNAVRTVAGRIPVVIGVADTSWDGQRDAGRLALPDGPSPLPDAVASALDDLEGDGRSALEREGAGEV